MNSIAVLHRLQQMFNLNVRRLVEIGNGAGNFDDFMLGPGGKMVVAFGLFEQVAGGRIERAEFFKFLDRHFTVGCSDRIGQASGLKRPGGNNPVSDTNRFFGGFGWLRRRSIDKNIQINSIKNRMRNSFLVVD